jgi:hypothetical protein
VGDDLREALAEDALGAETVATAEATSSEFEPNGDSVPGEVGDAARVIAVNAGRRAITSWALGPWLSGRHDEGQRAMVLNDLL